jgi:hypothetical protein
LEVNLPKRVQVSDLRSQEELMSNKLYCIVSSDSDADRILGRIQQAGFKPLEVVVANDATGIETLANPPQDLTRTTKWGIGLGALTGLFVGLVFMLLGGTREFFTWVGAPLIPFGAAFGWAFYGAILGGSGMFNKGALPPVLKRQFDEEISEGKVVIAIELREPKEFDSLADILYASGASDVHYGRGAAA